MLFISTEEKKHIMRLLEAIIYYEGKPISVEDIAQRLKYESQIVYEMLLELKKEYQFNERGIVIENNGNIFYFVINPTIKDDFFKVYQIRQQRIKLTDSLKDVLAIIAYKQPITKPEIEYMRGLDCSYSIRKLLEMNLIHVSGKKDVPGKPSLYTTTDEFLAVFGMSNLDQLPSLEDISLENPFYNEQREL